MQVTGRILILIDQPNKCCRIGAKCHAVNRRYSNERQTDVNAKFPLVLWGKRAVCAATGCNLSWCLRINPYIRSDEE